MTHYSHIPLVRILLPFMAGIIAFTWFEYFFLIQTILIIIASILLTGLLIRKYLLPIFQYSFIYGINVMLFMAVAGYVLAQSRNQLKSPSHFSHYEWEDSMLRIRLIEPVAEKTNSFQVVGKATHVVHNDSLKKARGKIIIWLQKDSLATTLKYGDIILIENHFQTTREPQNPHAFNYKRFLARQNIYHQSYRRSGEWYSTGINNGKFIVRYAHTMRQKALETLESNNITGKDFAVASALLLGFREYLDEDLQREFAGAGAMHILCVSGLHVGIIFMALHLLFGFLTRLPHGKYLKTFLIISLIWFYAAITGFSPSVMRASTMFSFVAIGQTFRRSTSIYNTLAASALILLVIDPYIISRLGFQLSYIAVVSIVALQPLFYRQLYFKNKVLNYAWGIITVSLAAQLGTGPLAVYYFNQFPNYFFITNLIVIPLTGIIIQSGILLFLTSPLSFLSQFVGIILSWMVLVLHTSVRIIENLPGSTSNHLVIAFHDKLAIFIIIFFGAVWWINKEKKWVFVAFAGLILLSLSWSIQSLRQQDQKQLIVYQVPRSTAIDLIHGNNCYMYACENVLNDPSLTSFNIHENRLRSGVGARTPINLKNNVTLPNQHVVQSDGFIFIEGHTIRLIDNENVIPSMPIQPVQVGHLIISNNPQINIQSLIETYPAQTIIFDSSNTLRNSQKWMNECDTLGIDCWSVGLQGAYVYNFRKAN